MNTQQNDMCEMVIIEDADLNFLWECSKCKVMHKATAKFERSKRCPTCGAEIHRWVGIDDYEEDAE